MSALSNLPASPPDPCRDRPQRALTMGAGLQWSTLAAVTITVIAWASAFPAIRAGLSGFGPLELGGLRFAVAAVPAVAYLAIMRPALPARGEIWRFVFGGVVFVGLYTWLLNAGELTVPAGAASFIINVNPILTALFAMAMLGERFGRAAWLGTLVSFAGIGLIALGEGGGLSLNAGALMIVGAALCTAVTTIVQKPLFARHHGLTVAAWNMVIGAIVLSPGLPGGIAQWSGASTEAIVSTIYLGIVPGAIAYGTWAMALSRLPASRATNFLYCVPPTATLIGYLWLGEVPTPLGIAGGLMALAGVVIVNLRRG